VTTEPTAPERTGPPRWLLVTLAAVAVAALAFAVGRFSTFGVTAQASAPTSDSAEAGFARDMQVHHAQAVDMAMTEYRQTEDPDLRALAYDIATAQSAQSGEMYSWLVRWGLPQRGGALMAWMAEDPGHADHGSVATPAPEAELLRDMGMATEEELAAFEAASGVEADCQFLTLMTRHHEGAIDMVDAILRLGSEPRVLQVAQSMKDVQQFELDAMAAAALRLGC
jgi:uncharacterized protein (DUF305 family)